MKNKGKKALTAVGAVVAAGLTPGIIAATPGCLPGQGSNAEITAAQVVAIDGTTYGFDELYAKQHPDSVKMDTIELNIVLEPDDDYVLDPDLIVMGQRTAKYGAPFRRANAVSAIFEVLEGDTIYRIVNCAPCFPGGDAALMNYLKDHIRYPANAIQNKIQGEVIIQLVVKKTGEIGNVKVLRSVDKDLDKEAVRVCKSLPDFIPARFGDKAVSTWHMLTVTFTLPEENINN